MLLSETLTPDFKKGVFGNWLQSWPD